MADVGLHLLALLVYPGALAALAFGVVAELAAATVLDRTGPWTALGSLLTLPRQCAGGALGPSVAAALLEVLAATQLAIPLNPVSPVERNLLVAAVALVAATWLGWTGSWTAPAARRALVVQGCWLVALLAPALVSQTLRPQALGAVVVPAQLPLKGMAALLAVACLPPLLPLLPGLAPAAAAGRLPRWLPLCGLVASVFAPPAAEDLGGLLRFGAVALATAGAAIGLAAIAARRPRIGDRWGYMVMPLAAVVLAAAVVTSLVA
jgi:hypothetical protein